MRRSLALALTSAALMAGCHSDEETPTPPSPEQQVRQALQRFGTATRERDYDLICTQLLSRTLTVQLDRIGLPCAIALEQGLGSRRNPQLEVRRVRVTGETANAEVRSTATGEPPSTDVLTLRRERGAWRITALAGAQPPKPPKPPKPRSSPTP